MDIALLLPWFPVLLGVGVGGRLLGKTRGLGLGVLGALLWLAVIHLPTGPLPPLTTLRLLALAAGMAAVIAMGAWSGEMGQTRAAAEAAARQAASSHAPAVTPESTLRTAYETALGSLGRLLEQYHEWLEDHRHDRDPWPKFDEFIRAALYQTCRATHVKPFRLVENSDEIIPLRDAEVPAEGTGLSARRGIIGHVVTTGRAYVAQDPTQGELVHKLAAEAKDPVAWCFPIAQGARRIGVVAAGHLAWAPELHGPLLAATAGLIQQFWTMLQEVCGSRSAAQHDPISGVLTRDTFFQMAEGALRESYRQGEPVACAVIAVEGLRQLHDTARWELADELVKAVCALLRRKVRLDDVLGRFDGSRFILLLRRVDSELATLIIGQLMFRLRAVCEDNPRWQVPIQVRCGVVGSGLNEPDMRSLVLEALQQARQARTDDTTICSDLLPGGGAARPVGKSA
ncbi:MAG TPA: GGDEF domain-containing protein [Phycisphaerae bacterium]|nr:GGDEF domain-containing protein [Phycisphaerae bacterium]HNU44348.1 GGDEF domain-containing protein [Phycisphaerae bacterium]